MAAGALRTVPLAGELTSSLINRAADRYGLPAADVLRLWTCRNSPARNDGGGVRADAEIVLNAAGRGVLAELCGVESQVLARALPAFTVDDPKISSGREAALAQVRWRAAGAAAGEAAFGCRPCTARRTGQVLRAVRYLPRWQRVCDRHGRWLLDADADQQLEHLDLRGVPEVAAEQRRWGGVARRAVRAAAEPNPTIRDLRSAGEAVLTAPASPPDPRGVFLRGRETCDQNVACRCGRRSGRAMRRARFRSGGQGHRGGGGGGSGRR